MGVLLLPWVFYQLIFVRKRRVGLAQRLGNSPVTSGKVLWCHAVSVGEVLAVSPMLNLFNKETEWKQRIVLSTVTVTGQKTAERECGFAKHIFYFPLDLPLVVHRALKLIKPEIYVSVETEIWPNFLAVCFRKRIPVVFVNGRISDSSYPRYYKFRWFFRPFLQRVSLFLMQSEEDARRIMVLGARPEAVKTTGNTKYDREPVRVSLPESILQWARGNFLLVAGSTHEGEEELIFEALRRLDKLRIKTVIVPRHPERFDSVASLLDKRRKTWKRFTRIAEDEVIDGDILLVDAMGVLDAFYALADAAFVGGSLVPVGGHNLLEPAMHGIPVLTGPYLHNFRDISRSLKAAGGCKIIKDETELADSLKMLILDDGDRHEMGRRSLAASRGFQGAAMENFLSIQKVLIRRDKKFGV
jgi:3-deoxy-D-manno-octulosonic-acid transferase